MKVLPHPHWKSERVLNLLKMLALLPNEILFMIAEKVWHFWLFLKKSLWHDKLPHKSLRSFSQVSLRIRAMLVPFVYHSITFSAANEWALNVLNIETYFQHHQAAQPDHYLGHTRELCFSAPISIARFNRCACYNIFRVVEPLRSSVSLGASNDTTAHLQFSNDLSEQVDMCLRWLRPHYLRSFRYVSESRLQIQWFEAYCFELASRLLSARGYSGWKWVLNLAAKTFAEYLPYYRCKLPSCRAECWRPIKSCILAEAGMGRNPASHGDRLLQKVYIAKSQAFDSLIGQICRLR